MVSRPRSEIGEIEGVVLDLLREFSRLGLDMGGYFAGACLDHFQEEEERGDRRDFGKKEEEDGGEEKGKGEGKEKGKGEGKEKEKQEEKKKGQGEEKLSEEERAKKEIEERERNKRELGVLFEKHLQLFC